MSARAAQRPLPGRRLTVRARPRREAGADGGGAPPGSALARLLALQLLDRPRRDRASVAAPPSRGPSLTTAGREAIRLQANELERTPPVLAQPPGRMEDERRSTGEPERVHADSPAVPGLADQGFGCAAAEEGRDHQPIGLQDPVHLEQPGAPLVGDVGEHRGREHEVEVRVREGQRGRVAVHLGARDRGAEMLAQPADHLGVDVAAVDLGDPRLVDEVAQQPPGTAAEVEDAATVELPALGQGLEDLLAHQLADPDVLLHRVVRRRAADPVGELRRRQRQPPLPQHDGLTGRTDSGRPSRCG